MTKRQSPTPNPQPLASLRQAIAGGRHWYVALLETMAEWAAPEEEVDGQPVRYVIGGEAFDWLALADRLCLSLDGVVPEGERDALLFRGRPPIELKPEEFRRLVGPAKYKAHLNFWYGVVVEDALHLAVEEEARKERRSRWQNEDAGLDDEVYRRIYGRKREEMLRAFQREKRLPRRNSLSLTGHKEFLYWLFRWRLRCQPRARVASDTKKGLERVGRMRREGLLSPRGTADVRPTR